MNFLGRIKIWYLWGLDPDPHSCVCRADGFKANILSVFMRKAFKWNYLFLLTRSTSHSGVLRFFKHFCLTLKFDNTTTNICLNLLYIFYSKSVLPYFCLFICLFCLSVSLILIHQLLRFYRKLVLVFSWGLMAQKLLLCTTTGQSAPALHQYRAVSSGSAPIRGSRLRLCSTSG